MRRVMLRTRPMKNYLFVQLFQLVCCQVASAQIHVPAALEGWWSHLTFLADDRLLGRETGSEGERKAAEYIAGVFQHAGLNPGGTAGFFQPIRFRSRRIVEEQSSLSLVREGEVQPVVLGEEATFNTRIDAPAHVDAPIVFAGYGLTVPEMNYNDLAGLDLRGKVVLLLTGAPRAIPGPLQAHYQAQRWEFLRRAGALGVLQIQNPRGMDIPWDRSMLRRFMPQLTLEDPALDETAGQKLWVVINPARAEKFFGGTGHSFAEILALAESEKPLPKFALAAAIRATVKVERESVTSQNVAGILPGTDPELKNEYVVLTAHYDHLGSGEAIQGDSIYNGALDNASGVATLLETAMNLHKMKTKLRRSVVFLAVTAEEKGLLGSRSYAAHPTVAAARIVANINSDMPLPLFPVRSLMVQGLEESDLAGDVRDAAVALGIQVVSDPEPERNSFTRSDQYSFIKRGVPSVALKVGFVKNSPEHEIVKRWRKERYHAPGDDLNQPIDFEGAAGFNRAYLLVVERVANRPRRPKWNRDSFFSRLAQ